MQKTHPVADFVDGGLALVEAVDVTARHCVGLDHATITDVCAGIRRAGTDVGRQATRAEDTASEVGQEVDVECSVGAVAEGSLQGSGIRASTYGPGIVCGVGGSNALELDVGGSVGGVQGSKLVVDHLLRDSTLLCGSSDDMESNINSYGLSCSSACNDTGDLCSTVCLEDALVHGADGLVEMRTGAADVNTTFKVLVCGSVGGFGAGTGQKTGKAEEDAGEVHVVDWGGRKTKEERCVYVQ